MIPIAVVDGSAGAALAERVGRKHRQNQNEREVRKKAFRFSVVLFFSPESPETVLVSDRNVAPHPGRRCGISSQRRAKKEKPRVSAFLPELIVKAIERSGWEGF